MLEKYITTEQVGGLVRNLVSPLIAFAIAKQILPVDGSEALATGVVSLVTFAWGWYVKRSPDALMNKEQWSAMIRNLGAPWLAFAIGKGQIAPEHAEWVMAGISSLSFAAWSYVAKKQNKELDDLPL